MKKKLVYILSFISRSAEFEMAAQLLSKEKYDLVFILLHDKDSYMEDFLKKNGIKTYRIQYSVKWDMFSAIRQIRKILKKEKADIVHAHLFDASLAGLIAAKLAGVKRRIHTRHNGTLHLVYHPNAVKYDKLVNRLSTDIVAVSGVIKDVMVNMEHADPNKIRVIHHGFDMTTFDNVKTEAIEKINAQYHLKEYSPVVGVISRFIEWKGVQYIIPAFKKLLEKYPKAHLVFANSEGPYTSEIEKLLQTLPQNSFTKVGFTDDVLALYKTFDMFIHVPIDKDSEAFGQVYVEAMASKVPCVVTLSGIANDYVKDKHNAVVVPFKDSDAIYQGMLELIGDKALREKIIGTAGKEVREEFPISKKIKLHEELYDSKT